MSSYNFTITFNLPNTADPNHHVDVLQLNGCDDALIGIGRLGKIALSFTREASSAVEAVYSAIADVQRAIPEATLIKVTPDLINIDEIATP